MPISAQAPVEFPATPAKTFDKWWVKNIQFSSDRPNTDTRILVEMVLYRDDPTGMSGVEICLENGVPRTVVFELSLAQLIMAKPEVSGLMAQVLEVCAAIARGMKLIDSAPPSVADVPQVVPPATGN